MEMLGMNLTKENEMAKQAMTKEELIERLNALTNSDKEAAHAEADCLLTDALLLAGMGDVVDAYIAAKDRVGFWYA